MKIPPKAAAIFGLWTGILLAIGAGTIVLPLGIPHDWIDVIKSWCVFIGAINSMVLTAAAAWSAPGAGPLAPPPTYTEARDIMTQAGIQPRAQPVTTPAKTNPQP